MSKSIVFSGICIIILLSIFNASADVSFTNDIDISDKAINLIITENYTGEDAKVFKKDFDIDNNSVIVESEMDVFRSDFLDNRANQFLEYIILDDDHSLLTLESIEMEFENVEGELDNSNMSITTMVSYGFASSASNMSLSSGDRSIWILGHPSINNIKISLPQNIELESHAGIDNITQSANGGRIVLEGSSGIRSFMVDEKPTFEYAVFLETSEQSFYEKAYFIPLLVLVELLLALTGYYIINKNKIK